MGSRASLGTALIFRPQGRELALGSRSQRWVGLAGLWPSHGALGQPLGPSCIGPARIGQLVRKCFPCPVWIHFHVCLVSCGPDSSRPWGGQCLLFPEEDRWGHSHRLPHSVSSCHLYGVNCTCVNSGHCFWQVTRGQQGLCTVVVSLQCKGTQSSSSPGSLSCLAP